MTAVVLDHGPAEEGLPQGVVFFNSLPAISARSWLWG